MMIEITPTPTEIELVANLVAAVDPVETDSGGVVVDVVNGHRTWSAFDANLAVRITGEPAEEHHRFVMAARSIAIAYEYARDTGSVTIKYDSDARTVTVASDSALAVVDVPTDRIARLAEIHPVEGPTANLSAGALGQLVHHTTIVPSGVNRDDLGNVNTVLFIEEDALGGYVDWDSIGARKSTVRVSAVTDTTATVAIEPSFGALHRLATAIDPDQILTLGFPGAPGGRMSITGQGWIAAVRCVDRTAGAWSTALEERFEQLGCRFHCEPDGTYLFAWEDHALHAALVDGGINRIRISRTLVEDVPRTEGLLTELNELSQGLHGLRLWWQEGSIICATDLPCDEILDLDRAVRDLLIQTDLLGRLLGSIAADEVDA